MPVVNRILEEHNEGNILIVWHAAVGQVYVGHVLGIPSSRARTIQLDNGGVTVGRLDGSKVELLTISGRDVSVP